LGGCRKKKPSKKKKPEKGGHTFHCHSGRVFETQENKGETEVATSKKGHKKSPTVIKASREKLMTKIAFPASREKFVKVKGTKKRLHKHRRGGRRLGCKEGRERKTLAETPGIRRKNERGEPNTKNQEAPGRKRGGQAGVAISWGEGEKSLDDKITGSFKGKKGETGGSSGKKRVDGPTGKRRIQERPKSEDRETLRSWRKGHRYRQGRKDKCMSKSEKKRRTATVLAAGRKKGVGTPERETINRSIRGRRWGKGERGVK